MDDFEMVEDAEFDYDSLLAEWKADHPNTSLDEEAGDPEVREYLRDILRTFTTGSDQDLTTIDQLSQSLASLTGRKREEMRDVMIELRKEYFKLIAEGKTEEEARYMVESKIYKGTIMTIRVASLTSTSITASAPMMAGSYLISATTYAFCGFVLAAQTATDYHKMKKGKLTKAEFKQRLKENSA